MKNAFFAILAFFICGCKTKSTVDPATKPVTFSNVLILGNSITYTAQDPSIGWTGNWGMAASAADKDYVHILTTKLQVLNKDCKVQVKPISAFELGYNTFDFDSELKTLRDSKPDLLIIRIGENVQPTFDPVAFDARYQALLAYMKVGNPNLKILAAGSFWPQREYVNNIVSKYSPYVALESLGMDITNYATNLTGVSDGVKQHPNDKGMQGIADLIWGKIIILK